MHRSLQLLLPAFLAATQTAAQEYLATVDIWNRKGCGENFNDPDSTAFSIDVFKDLQIEKPGDLENGCMYKSFAEDSSGNDIWEDGDSGKILGFVDQETVPEDCELVIYEGPPTDAEGQGQCFSFVQRIPHANKCAKFQFGKELAYSMCCGQDACEVASGTPGNKLKREEPAKQIRDVTKIKRGSPLAKRVPCKFTPDNEDDEASYIWYGPQERVTPIVTCGTNECTDGIDFTHTTSVSSSTTIGASAGATFFSVVSVSVTMEQTWTNEQSDAFTITYGSTRPAGSSGYVTWRQKFECTPNGKFSGGCDWETGVTTWGCFPLFLDGIPDGLPAFVQNS